MSHELTFFPLPGCFELFGFDLMVDADWRLWLLEANAEPDFGQVRWPQILQSGYIWKARLHGVRKCESSMINLVVKAADVAPPS